jgi:hypothetical protein
MEEVINAYNTSAGKYERKKPRERHRHIWEDNIRIDVRLMGCEVDCIYLAQDRYQWRAFMKTVMNIRVP